MKLKKTILGLAVVAVAGVNAWLANDVMSAKNDLSLLSIENLADAEKIDRVEWEQPSPFSYPRGEREATVSVSFSVSNGVSITVGISAVACASLEGSNEIVTIVCQNVYCRPCLGEDGNTCTDKYDGYTVFPE